MDMVFGVCVIIVIYNVCKSVSVHNQKYFGTDREIQRGTWAIKVAHYVSM